jgi:hypothetical protein
MKVIHSVLRQQGTCRVARVDCLAIKLQNQFGLYGNPESREEYLPDRR